MHKDCLLSRVLSHFHLFNDKMRPIFYSEPKSARHGLCQSFIVRISSSGQSIVSMPECHYLCVSLRHLTLMDWSRKLCSKPNEHSYNFSFMKMWQLPHHDNATSSQMVRACDAAALQLVWLSCQRVFKLLLIQTTITTLTDVLCNR